MGDTVLLDLAYPPPPLAPIDSTVSSAGATVALVSLSGLTVLGLAWAVAVGVRRRDPLFLAVYLGGAATVLLEPFADLLGMVWFPVQDQVHAFTMLGIPIPLFVAIGYGNMFGLLPWMFLCTLAAGTGRRRYWSVSVMLMMAACVFEWLLLRTEAYFYYGNQPLNVWGYPMIWMTINTGACLLAAAILHKLPGLFTGARAFAAVALVPCCDGAVMLGTGWPAFAAIHTDLAKPLVHLAGLVTIALGLWLYVLVADLCCTDGRLRDSITAAAASGRARLAEGARS
jgi:hypothetical protein